MATTAYTPPSGPVDPSRPSLIALEYLADHPVDGWDIYLHDECIVCDGCGAAYENVDELIDPFDGAYGDQHLCEACADAALADDAPEPTGLSGLRHYSTWGA